MAGSVSPWTAGTHNPGKRASALEQGLATVGIAKTAATRVEPSPVERAEQPRQHLFRLAHHDHIDERPERQRV